MEKQRQSYTLEFKLKAAEIRKVLGKTIQATQKFGTTDYGQQTPRTKNTAKKTSRSQDGKEYLEESHKYTL